jgi:hypothetical protein
MSVQELGSNGRPDARCWGWDQAEKKEAFPIPGTVPEIYRKIPEKP